MKPFAADRAGRFGGEREHASPIGQPRFLQLGLIGFYERREVRSWVSDSIWRDLSKTQFGNHAGDRAWKSRGAKNRLIMAKPTFRVHPMYEPGDNGVRANWAERGQPARR